MKQENMVEKTTYNQEMTNAPALTPEQIPPSYARCFQADCPNADTCARFLAGKYIPTGKVWGDAVYPTARQGNTCTMYKQTRVIRAAYGFKAIFAEVKQKDDTPERRHAPAQPHQGVFGRKHHVLPLSSRRETAYARATGLDYQPLPPSGIYGGIALRWVSGAV